MQKTPYALSAAILILGLAGIGAGIRKQTSLTPQPVCSTLFGDGSLCSLEQRINRSEELTKAKTLRVADGDYKFTHADALATLPAHGMLRKSRADGMRELQEYARTAQVEQHYFFIPKENVWINDSEFARTTTVGQDETLLSVLCSLYPEVEEIHIHPEAAAQQLLSQKSLSSPLEVASPSSADLYATQDAPANARSSVVSRFGVTTYKVRFNKKLPNYEQNTQMYLLSRQIRDKLAAAGEHDLRSKLNTPYGDVSLRFEKF